VQQYTWLDMFQGEQRKQTICISLLPTVSDILDSKYIRAVKQGDHDLSYDYADYVEKKRRNAVYSDGVGVGFIFYFILLYIYKGAIIVHYQ
jgi:hypothetical protein